MDRASLKTPVSLPRSAGRPSRRSSSGDNRDNRRRQDGWTEDHVDPQERARSIKNLVHELNNQLFVIGGHCELLALQFEPGSRAHADLAAILAATDRAGELASQMRALITAHAAVPPAAGAPDVDAC